MKRMMLITALSFAGLVHAAETNPPRPVSATGTPRENVVFIEAHPDDLASHSGTAILMAEKFNVKVVDFTRGENGLGEAAFRDGSCARTRVEEEKRACRLLDTEPVFMDEVNYRGSMAYASEKTTKRLAELFKEWKPRAVIMHWPIDTHPDHVQSTAAALHALSLAGLQPEIYFHSQPRQTRNFQPQYRVDVTRVKAKRDELTRCYACQGPEELIAVHDADALARSTRLGVSGQPPARYIEPFAAWDGSVRNGRSVFLELNAPVE